MSVRFATLRVVEDSEHVPRLQQTRPPRELRDLVASLAGSGERAQRLTHVEVLPPRVAEFAPWPEWVDPGVRRAFERGGVDHLWRHQVAAAEAAYAGQHVVIATGTASGKSLGYLLPSLTTIADERGARGQRGATALYLSPTKALAHDQFSSIRSLDLDVRISTHDGDSSREERDWTRAFGEYVLTNPDMLHRSLLPRHEQWASFFGSLRYVVLDECHHYRGVFGAHVAQILRRLRRVCAAHGAHPTFVLASATIAQPEVSGARLTGLDLVAVTKDYSPRGQVALALWEPPFVSHAGENGAPVRRSAAAETADLLTDLVAEGVRTLAFVRSRRGAEQVAATAADNLREVDSTLAQHVAAYRGGYLPEERRELERAFKAGELIGLAATNALELGIDISGLDAVLIAGFPGTRAALWQQVGRAGRTGQDALGILVARDDPLDTYLVNHPESLFGRPIEATVFDPTNRYVLGPHLCAAAAEIPLTEADFELFGPTTAAAVTALTEAGLLRRRSGGWFWTDLRRASDLADLRSTGGPAVQLVDEATGRVVGNVDHSSSHSAAHTGAVYVHQGETWLIAELDLDQGVALMSPTEVNYSTTARTLTDISIVSVARRQQWGAATLSFGSVEVTHQTVSFLKRRRPGGDVLGEEPLQLPARSLVTSAVWWTIPDHLLEEAGLAARDLPGAAHAAEHCSIGLLPLFATCDRWDIGGVSTARHGDTGQLTVFVHDGHPGGAGFAERGFELAREWLTATRETIVTCTCDEGCPSCVQSPKCGNQNNPLDKAAAAALLAVLLESV